MQSNANSPWLPSAHRADYASAIPEYLARTTEDLTTWDGPTATPARPAGELLLPQYLSEHFGSSIVTDILVRMNGRPVDPDTSDGVAGARVSGDPLTAITASLAARGHDLPTVLQDFAEASWNLGCPTGADQYGYCSPELTRWLAVLQGDTRTAGAHGDAPSPVHQTVAVSDLFAGSSGQATLGAGGSAYILLALPSVDPNCSGFLCYNGGITVTTAGDEAIPYTTSLERLQTPYGASAKAVCGDVGRTSSSTSDRTLTSGGAPSGFVLGGDGPDCTAAVLVLTRDDTTPGGALGTNHPNTATFSFHVQLGAASTIVFN